MSLSVVLASPVPAAMGSRAQGSSAQGLLALLQENEPLLQAHALRELHAVVDSYWSEVAGSVPLIEALSEDPQFEHRELAAAVASRCFFHLEEYNDALRLALGAGAYFDVAASAGGRSPAETQYTAKMVSICVDEYVRLRNDGDDAVVDARMVNIVERMFDRCYADHAWTQAMGVALEARRLDKVQEVLERAGQEGAKAGLLAFTTDLCVGQQQLLPSRDFRMQVLDVMAGLHRSMPDDERDYAAEVHCLQHLDRAAEAGQTLRTLLQGTEAQELLAYQLAFDIAESDHQPFILALLEQLDPAPASPPPPPTTPAAANAAGGAVDADAAANEPPATADASAPTAMEEDGAVVAPAGSAGTADAGNDAPAVAPEKLEKLSGVLRASGFMVDLQVNFLHGQSRADRLLLLNVKDSLEPRNATLHQATVTAHALMFAGTANTSFVREHIEWFGRSSNWAKFSATGSIGVIHRPKGTLAQSKQVLQAYLPQPGTTSSPYSEGGALYALGLIHAAKAGGAGGAAEDEAVLPYLVEVLGAAGPNEPLQHGACLAIGLTAMGTADPALYEILKNVLFNDSAIGSEAAAYGIGLLLLGRAQDNWAAETLTELLAYAHDTQHEKIIRALGMAAALASYGREEGADVLIETLARDRDPIVRYGAMFTIGLAYAGTGANGAVRRLLHVAVSDVSDDVRRAAVLNLGLLLFRQPERLPPLVALLSESYNPHVRYGAALALGIAHAGRAGSDAGRTALHMLEQMHDDVVDFVRQGSLIGSALVLMQQPDSFAPVKAFREKIAGILREKHPSTMTKMGAILAHGLLDAGGRNVTLALSSRAGFTKASAVVGVALWAQHWYWYPLQHMLGLSFSPTALIGLNKDFAMPKAFSATCTAKPSMFAYPKMTEAKKEDKKERVATVTLSTTAKAKAREAKKEKAAAAAAADNKMAVDDENKPSRDDAEAKDASRVADAGEATGVAGGGDDKAATTATAATEAGAGSADGGVASEASRKRRVSEPTSFALSNPSRVTPEQEQHVSFDWEPGARYVPVNPRSTPAGIVVLLDRQPDEPEDVALVEIPAADGDEDEAKPPEPFEWSPDMQ